MDRASHPTPTLARRREIVSVFSGDEADVGSVRVEPDDVIVVRMKRRASPEAVDTIAAQTKSMWPANRVVVLDATVELEVWELLLDEGATAARTVDRVR